MGRHLVRFKLLYITLIISISSAIVASLGPLKDMTPAQLHAFSWVYWAVVFFNIVVAAGNNIVAALSTPPPDVDEPEESKPPKVELKPTLEPLPPPTPAT